MVTSCLTGHCRFATSSIPTAAESHPHQWTSSEILTFWLPADTQKPSSPLVPACEPDHSRHLENACQSRSKAEGITSKADIAHSWQLHPVSTPHGVFVTHNGDFEGYKLFGQMKTLSEVVAWLSAVLHLPAPASCDSVAIAGEAVLAHCMYAYVHITQATGLHSTKGLLLMLSGHNEWRGHVYFPQTIPMTKALLLFWSLLHFTTQEVIWTIL